jgi:hypothetical protein
MDDVTAAGLSYTANFVATALLDLVHCLKNQGALGAHQYEDALRATIEADGAPRDRLDYQFLAQLLAVLEKQSPGQPPVIDSIH